MNRSDIFYHILWVFLGGVICCLAGFQNGYPLVYPDTGEYLNSGFEAIPPYDRTIFYGLFARHLSLYFSLWLVIFSQGILVSYLLFITTGIFFSGKKRALIFIFSIVFLCLTTGLSYNVSIIMPDIFSPISVLCLIILLLHRDITKLETIIVAVIFTYSLATQVSSFLIFLLVFLLLAAYIIVKRIRKKPMYLNFKRVLLSVFLFLSAIIITPTIHFFLGGNFTLSNGSHVFIMNHFLETGILKDYLDKSCGDHTYKLCAYKDKLGNNLMWEIEGPLYKTGGWEANKKEYNAIIKDVITTPAYLKTLISKGAKCSFDQFFTYEVAVAPPQLDNTAPFGQIEWRFNKEIGSYTSSLQNKGSMNVGIINSIGSFLIPVSIVLTLIALFFKTIPPTLKWAILLVFIYAISSSIICSNFSTTDARYQNRVVWLFTFLAILFIFKWFENRFKNGSTTELFFT